MPWKEVTSMEERKRFVELASEWQGNFKDLCSAFGISAKTGYKYLNRYHESGLLGLKEQSRQPKTNANKTKANIADLVIKARQLHPSWGGEKLKNYLHAKGHKELPTEKTIDRILRRNGLITAEASEKHKPWKRFEHENPNDLWQMDFKGHFATANGRCHPLTVLDDHSRYSLLIKACKDEQRETVKEALIETFREYGLPKRMTMDNGPPWGYSGDQLHTVLCAWLIRLGIYVTHSRPRHPQTQGKLERFHRTLKTELLSAYSFEDIDEAQKGFKWWQKIYNEERPHEAIGFKTPSKRYTRSEIDYPEKLPPIEYDGSLIIRKVQKGGLIHFKGKEYRIGTAFYGNHVGLKEAKEEGLMDVYFCHQRVLKISINF
jgi:transposase InsO family protein